MVGDARFETQLNKENKRSWLQEIRQLSRDSELSEDDLILVDDDTILVSPTLEEEPFEEAVNEIVAKATAATAGTPLDKKDTVASKQRTKSSEEKDPEEATVVLTLKDGMVTLTSVLKTIDVRFFRNSPSCLNDRKINSYIHSIC